MVCYSENVLIFIFENVKWRIIFSLFVFKSVNISYLLKALKVLQRENIGPFKNLETCYFILLKNSLNVFDINLKNAGGKSIRFKKYRRDLTVLYKNNL